MKKILKTIFDYHRLENSPELKQLWHDDLYPFNETEITKAWNEWRKSEANDFKKPTSWDIARIIKKSRPKPNRQNIVPNVPLKKGISFTEDLLIDKLQMMNATMPDLNERVKECKSAKEKIILCAVASGDEKLVSHPLVKSFVNKLNNE